MHWSVMCLTAVLGAGLFVGCDSDPSGSKEALAPAPQSREEQIRELLDDPFVLTGNGVYRWAPEIWIETNVRVFFDNGLEVPVTVQLDGTNTFTVAPRTHKELKTLEKPLDIRITDPDGALLEKVRIELVHNATWICNIGAMWDYKTESAYYGDMPGNWPETEYYEARALFRRDQIGYFNQELPETVNIPGEISGTWQTALQHTTKEPAPGRSCRIETGVDGALYRVIARGRNWKEWYVQAVASAVEASVEMRVIDNLNATSVLYVDDVRITELNQNVEIGLYCAPGVHTFRVDGDNGSRDQTVDTEGGGEHRVEFRE